MSDVAKIINTTNEGDHVPTYCADQDRVGVPDRWGWECRCGISAYLRNLTLAQAHESYAKHIASVDAEARALSYDYDRKDAAAEIAKLRSEVGRQDVLLQAWSDRHDDNVGALSDAGVGRNDDDEIASGIAALAKDRDELLAEWNKVGNVFWPDREPDDGWSADDVRDAVKELRSEVERLTRERDEARAAGWNANVEASREILARAETAEAELAEMRRSRDNLIAERDVLYDATQRQGIEIGSLRAELSALKAKRVRKTRKVTLDDVRAYYDATPKTRDWKTTLEIMRKLGFRRRVEQSK